MSPNQSYYTDGTDDPNRDWLQRVVRVRSRPEWGRARVMRWYPATGATPARLRIMAEHMRAPQIVPVSDVDVLTA